MTDVAGGLGAIALAGPGCVARQACTAMTAAEWGGGELGAMKRIAARQSAADVK